jgi:hypothetical protein
MKYHPLELQGMAVQFLMHQQSGDARCEDLIGKLQERFPTMTGEMVMNRIHRLAMMQPVID